MKKVALIVADGTEELEAITPVDVLRRAGAQCDIVSVSGEYVTTSHNVIIKADKTIKEVALEKYDALIIPGGIPGAGNIAKTPAVIKAVIELNEKGKLLAAICAAPAVVLGAIRILDGKKVTCYPSEYFLGYLKNAEYTGAEVEVCDNIITADGPTSAFKFSLAICKYLGIEPKF